MAIRPIPHSHASTYEGIGVPRRVRSTDRTACLGVRGNWRIGELVLRKGKVRPLRATEFPMLQSYLPCEDRLHAANRGLPMFFPILGAGSTLRYLRSLKAIPDELRFFGVRRFLRKPEVTCTVITESHSFCRTWQNRGACLSRCCPPERLAFSVLLSGKTSHAIRKFEPRRKWASGCGLHGANHRSEATHVICQFGRRVVDTKEECTCL